MWPSMYTEVSLFLGWIDEKLERERYNERIGGRGWGGDSILGWATEHVG